MEKEVHSVSRRGAKASKSTPPPMVVVAVVVVVVVHLHLLHAIRRRPPIHNIRRVRRPPILLWRVRHPPIHLRRVSRRPPIHLRRRSRSRRTARKPAPGILTRTLMYLRPQGYRSHH